MTLRIVSPSTEERASARVARVAELLDVDQSQVRRLVYNGELEGHRVGKRGVRIFLDSVEAYQNRGGLRKRTSRARAASPPPKPTSASRAAHRAALAELKARGLV